jgi:hypothetical protein
MTPITQTPIEGFESFLDGGLEGGLEEGLEEELAEEEKEEEEEEEEEGPELLGAAAAPGGLSPTLRSYSSADPRLSPTPVMS